MTKSTPPNTFVVSSDNAAAIRRVVQYLLYSVRDADDVLWHEILYHRSMKPSTDPLVEALKATWTMCRDGYSLSELCVGLSKIQTPEAQFFAEHLLTSSKSSGMWQEPVLINGPEKVEMLEKCKKLLIRIWLGWSDSKKFWRNSKRL